MARAAGNKSYYTFNLYNEGSGKHDKSKSIQLDSVTSIISATLAKPALVWWAYATTVEAISGMVAAHLEADEGHPDIITDILDTLSDADELGAYLKENRLRPEDQRDEAASRGSEAHDFLKLLSKSGMVELTQADKVAQRSLRDDPEGYRKGLSDWWMTRKPRPEASEKMLISLKHQYAGTVDLVYWDANDMLVLMDLKTRKEGGKAYDSDYIQVGAYVMAWNETHREQINRGTVLIVQPNGKWEETVSPFANEVFLDLVSVYRATRKG